MLKAKQGDTMLRLFFDHHPFLKGLIKRCVTIVVSWGTVVMCIIATLFFVGVLFMSEPEPESSYQYVYGNGTNELLSIKVSGTITGTETSGSLLGVLDSWETAGYSVKEKLYAAADDNLINGVILEIESPGGTIYGSRAITDGVKYYQEKTGNPVYAYVEGMAASGAYWAAASTDKIIADYGSDIGSIGVIMGPFQYYDQVIAADDGLLNGGVITQNGIENTLITAGKSKDIGNPYRRLTSEEIAILQRSVNNEYANFVQYVSKQRKIPEDTIKNTIGAMTYDNQTAKDLKLIDETGSRDDAYAALAKASGVEDDFQVVREEYAPTFLQSLLMATVYKPKQSVQTSGCATTRSSLLAYHGDVAKLCNTHTN